MLTAILWFFAVLFVLAVIAVRLQKPSKKQDAENYGRFLADFRKAQAESAALRAREAAQMASKRRDI